ncbi:hypothetical protein [Erysipelothrix anatis]|uniref:hypothetical protein n=1 Tax=Erysipelothrix anatis TaxID=2683713 RepID=UPI00135CED1C|nr:hypothetical protein [Erysipelothrix anatis]
MRRLNTTLSLFTNANEFELLEVSRRKQFIDGEATDVFDSIYKILLNYEPVEIRVHDDGAIADKADVVNSYRQQGNPLLISFEDCQISVSPKTQYELRIYGTANKATLVKAK